MNQLPVILLLDLLAALKRKVAIKSLTLLHMGKVVAYHELSRLGRLGKRSRQSSFEFATCCS
jgi:hypothetical protein